MKNLTAIKDILDDFLAQNFTSYVQVLPHGFKLKSGEILPQITGEIHSSSPARTLYENSRPVCRSLDGLYSLKENRPCATCPNRKACTPQFLLDLSHAKGVLRFLFAFTSARNYMTFLSLFVKDQREISGSLITLSVVNRGHWGEIRFSAHPKT